MIPSSWLSTKSKSFALASVANRQGWTSGQCLNSKQRLLYRRTVFFLSDLSSVLAQCAVDNSVVTVWWPCGIMAIAVETLSHRRIIFLRLFFYVLLGWKLENLFRFSFSDTRNIFFWNTQNRSKWHRNPKFRVRKSRFPWKSCIPSNRTSRDKYMLNNLSRRIF